MFSNLHTHTIRCRHAEGSDREYIEAAIAGGIKKLGFSDHIPFEFPDGFCSDYRVPVGQAEKYVESLSRLREEYREKIEIYIGFEMEYYPDYFDDMYKNAVRWGAEYLLLGQHFTRSEHPGGFYCGCKTTREEELDCFVNDTISGIASGVFTYVAHPDLINFVGNREVYRRKMRRLCEAASEQEIPLEINLLGIRGERRYPNPDFWQVAGESGCKAVIGSDAHRPCDVVDDLSLEKALTLARESGVTVIDDPDIVFIGQNIMF